MLTASPLLLAHQNLSPEPHDLWSAWALHPLVVVGLGVPTAAYVWGHHRAPRHDRRRARYALLGLCGLTLALLSPIDALAGELASAHMVQHVLLTMVAPPFLVLAAPLPTLLRGLPRQLQRRVHRARRVNGIPSVLQAAQRPVVVWLLHVAALWIWHSATLYEGALRYPFVHALEHLSFIVTGLLFWHAVLAPRRSASAGTGLLLLFTMALQGVILSALLTFASTPWYDAYTRTSTWGLHPLTDQQLAGVIMWIPGGLIYLSVALTLLVAAVLQEDHETPGLPARTEPASATETGITQGRRRRIFPVP